MWLDCSTEIFEGKEIVDVVQSRLSSFVVTVDEAVVLDDEEDVDDRKGRIFVRRLVEGSSVVSTFPLKRNNVHGLHEENEATMPRFKIKCQALCSSSN